MVKHSTFLPCHFWVDAITVRWLKIFYGFHCFTNFLLCHDLIYDLSIVLIGWWLVFAPANCCWSAAGPQPSCISPSGSIFSKGWLTQTFFWCPCGRFFDSRIGVRKTSVWVDPTATCCQVNSHGRQLAVSLVVLDSGIFGYEMEFEEKALLWQYNWAEGIHGYLWCLLQYPNCLLRDAGRLTSLGYTHEKCGTPEHVPTQAKWTVARCPHQGHCCSS